MSKISDHKVEVIKRELLALGQDYRLDWSEFDGRTLLHQLQSFVNFIESSEEDFDSFSEGLKETSRRI